MNGIHDAYGIWSLWRHFRLSVSPHTNEDIDIVFNIGANNGHGHRLTVGKLVKAGIASRNTVLRRLDVLLRGKLVTAQPAEHDGRVRELALTAKGKTFMRRITTNLRHLCRAVHTRR